MAFVAFCSLFSIRKTIPLLPWLFSSTHNGNCFCIASHRIWWVSDINIVLMISSFVWVKRTYAYLFERQKHTDFTISNEINCFVWSLMSFIKMLNFLFGFVCLFFACIYSKAIEWNFGNCCRFLHNKKEKFRLS